jgi:signal transduction histidine kinase
MIEGVVRAKRPQRLPVVLTQEEAAALLGQLKGVHLLVAMLLYGAGLRLLEALRLRVKDVDLERGELVMFSGVTIDVSQRKSAEQDRERLRTQLGQAQKMESIGMLTSGIAHDFNNILGSILGYAGLALQRYASTSPPKLAEYLNEVVTAGERARDLVAQLLAFSRGESVAVQATAIGPIIEQSLRMLRPALPSSVNMQLNLASNLPLVMANAVQFQQVLVNLCVNARDATNGNGVITVSAAPVQLEPVACASCHQNFSGRFVALTVEDTGEGIPESTRLRIFEPFFTTKAQGKGSGMGLAMVHGIVHRQGGHILLDSRPGAGTRFRLLMPVSAEAVEETPPQPSAEHRLSAATANCSVPH